MSAIPKMMETVKLSKSASDKRLLEKFDSRKSEELMIALAGPIGCGITSVISIMTEELKERGYVDVVHIKLSKFLEDALNKSLVPAWPSKDGASARFIRYRRLQEAGKSLRKSTENPAILAQYVAQEIAVHRREAKKTEGEPLPGPIVPSRVAYIVDQVKRPEEISLLRAIYRNMFYLAGVTRIYELRVDELTREGVRRDEVDQLMEIDRYEDGADGQQLDKTLHLADYFIRNDSSSIQDKKKKIKRFLDLVHGDKSITPTNHESGMYAAYSAGLRSACLSRQVGASIAASTGEIIATGCNDVPKASGGLYTESYLGVDMRCVHKDGQQCLNDLHKHALQDQIGSVIDRFLRVANDKSGIAANDRDGLLEAIYKETRLKDLIEFSRSVHAEMDAIVSLARVGGSGLKDATLYTTTFPCHNCARHIVASGIMKVFYIEPYEKSLAKDLHSDSIAFEIEESKAPKRVEFLHFEGVSPRQFNNMFRALGRKDSRGKFIAMRIQEAPKILNEYVDAYQDFEAKAVEHLVEELEKLSKEVLDKKSKLENNSATGENSAA